VWLFKATWVFRFASSTLLTSKNRNTFYEIKIEKPFKIAQAAQFCSMQESDNKRCNCKSELKVPKNEITQLTTNNKTIGSVNHMGCNDFWKF
jgi:hypothetical protein